MPIPRWLSGFAVLLATVQPPIHAQARLPIIDAHLHAFTGSWSTFRDTSWFPRHLPRVATTDELIAQTVAFLERYNVVRAVASSRSLDEVALYSRAAPGRIIPALMLTAGVSLDSVRAWHAAGRLAVLGEAVWQYQGLSPNDSSLDPLWSLAEQLDLPVAIHMGPGPPGVPYEGHYRMKLSDPLLLEEVLVRHPRLRVQVMHAGWPMLDHMIALLYSYPNVYVDVAVLNWFIPRPEFHAYLRRLVAAGFSDRIMYGSDQMQWPSAIPIAIEAIESAGFLTRDQKRDILCRNAARFFRLGPGRCD